MLAEPKHPAPRFLGEHAPAKPRWPGAQRPVQEKRPSGEPRAIVASPLNA